MTSPLRQAAEGLPVRALTIIVVVTLIVSAGATTIAWWMTPSMLIGRQLGEPRAPIADVEQRVFRETPRGAETSSHERARIDRYEWVDSQVARVPIARAIELVARGCRPTGAGDSAFQPSRRGPCASEETP